MIHCTHDIIKRFLTKGREKVTFSFRVDIFGLIVIGFITLCTANEQKFYIFNLDDSLII